MKASLLSLIQTRLFHLNVKENGRKAKRSVLVEKQNDFFWRASRPEDLARHCFSRGFFRVSLDGLSKRGTTRSLVKDMVARAIGLLSNKKAAPRLVDEAFTWRVTSLVGS